MILSEISVKRPVLATVVSLLIIVLGLASLSQLAVREYPNIDAPIVSVSTTYLGASPTVMNNEVTEVVEGAISGVDGVRNITSESREGRAETTIEFTVSRDIDNAANDVRDAVSRVLGRLPGDADTPVIRKTDADARPMLWLALTSDRLSPAQLTDLAERSLVDRLSVLDGVAQVQVGGARRYAMRIWLDREAMAARGVTVADVEETLRRNNLELPAGQIESVNRSLTVRADSRLDNPDQFRRLVIRVDAGYPIRIGDVAEVDIGVEDDRTVLRSNGRDAIGLGVIRQSQANIIDVADRVYAEIDAIRPSLPAGVELTGSYDQSVFIRESVREVVLTLAIAVGLVVLVIFVFLRSVRATLVPAVTIPVAVVGAFSVMAPLGFSINVLTLLALVLAIGLVVDDAIVMLENIQRRIDDGEPALLAAYRGSGQVGFAIIATTVTLVAVFIPIAFMEGSVGRLFTEFGFVLAAAVVFSSVVALTLTPMLCSRWLRPTAGSGALVRGSEVLFEGLTRGYRWLLLRALGAPLVVILASLVVAALAVRLFDMIPEELSPTEDRGVFIIPSSAPQGSTAAFTDAGVRQLEAVVQPLIDRGDANRVFSIVGFRDRFESAFTIVGLAHWDAREARQQDLVREVFPGILTVPGLRAFAVNPPGLGQSGFQQPVQFVVGGPDYAAVSAWGERLLARVRENPQLLNPSINFEETRPQLAIEINRELAADLGIPVDVIGRTLQTMLASRTVTSYLDRGREYDVRLQAQPGQRASPSDLAGLFVRAGNTGQLVPLSSLIRLQERAISPVLNRVDRMPAVTLSASLAPGYDLGSALAFVQSAADEVLPREARTSLLGQSQEFLDTTGALYLTFALALVVVYLVLAAQFESFIHPAIILLSVPLAVTGALVSLLVTGVSLNVYSQIGMILLIGLMAKNGILIVEFANQLRDQGYAIREAVTEGAILRFRPILMTAISTVFGALPLVLATGAGAESRLSIGVVVIGGLTMATVLTLFLTPVLYDLLARYTRSSGAVAAELQRLQGNKATAPAALRDTGA